MSTVLVSLACAGCVDAKGSFDDFAARVVDANTSMVDRPNFTTIPDITGEFRLIARPPLQEDRFLKFDVVYVMTANADGTATLMQTATALRVADGQPSTQQPPLVTNDVHVALDGTFDAPLNGKIPGDANPVVPGNAPNIVGDILGEIRTADFVCGTLTGTAGISLQGSTFAAERKGTESGTDPFKCPSAIDAGI